MANCQRGLHMARQSHNFQFALMPYLSCSFPGLWLRNWIVIDLQLVFNFFVWVFVKVIRTESGGNTVKFDGHASFGKKKCIFCRVG